ncbi:MAG: endo-1,4-beta-xylanase, partial [Treponema sp.]|nr:endo-1,4-beta-xylanase [Treponema sp.]
MSEMTNPLFETFKDDFRLGAALAGFIYDDDFASQWKKFHSAEESEGEEKAKFQMPDFSNLTDKEIASKHFNLIVAENDTKMERVYKGLNDFDFSKADKLIKFGKANNQDIRWHTLVWHSQSPDWIFDKDAKAEPRPKWKPGQPFKMPSAQEIAAKCTVSKAELEKRLQNYIFTVGDRYKNDICSVDVVNECISDKSFKLRTIEDYSRWSYVLGEDYIEKAFFWAKEAFPKSSLVINDYNLEMIKGKREGIRDLLEGLLRKGVPVDTVGLQMHIDIQNPPVSEIAETIEMFGKLGLRVIVTEMEVSMYKDREEARRDFTPADLEEQAHRYKEIFDCFREEARRGILQDVVLWGVTDRFSWKNNFPVPGRTDAPLLFDAEGKAKPAFYGLIK